MPPTTSQNPESLADNVGAFVRGERSTRTAQHSGPLDGLACAVKDVFDMAGVPTGYGNPVWKTSHPLPLRDATVISRVLHHGAHIVGKTITDELAFSLAGNNFHDGSPLNPAAHERLTGGSSCGSAAAVAAGLCDFALGTDTGGSVRAPASFCGIYGFRPTHGVIPVEGVCRLAPSFDTVGWLAPRASTLLTVAQVLLPQDSRPLSNPTVARLSACALSALPGPAFGPTPRTDEVVIEPDVLDTWFEAFRTLQFHEVWRELGPWVQRTQPLLGPDVRARMVAASQISEDAFRAATLVRQTVRDRMAAVFDRVGLLAMATVPGPAPRRDASLAELDVQRRQAMRFLCMASLAGLPQVSVPAFRVDDAPVGLSFMGPAGSDRSLLEFAAKACADR